MKMGVASATALEMLMKYLILALACTFVASGSTLGETDLSDGVETVKYPTMDIVFHGKLRDGIVVIGGENTGTTITAGEPTISTRVP